MDDSTPLSPTRRSIDALSGYLHHRRTSLDGLIFIRRGGFRFTKRN